MGALLSASCCAFVLISQVAGLVNSTYSVWHRLAFSEKLCL